MPEDKTQNLCDLSSASFRNIIAAINKISELSVKIADIGYRNDALSAQDVKNILHIVSATEECVMILDSYGSGDFERIKKDRFFSEKFKQEQGLKVILFRISESARLITRLKMTPLDEASSKEIDFCRRNLLLVASALSELATGTICNNLFEGRNNNCHIGNCIRL